MGYFALLLAAAVYYLMRWGDQLPDLLGQIQPAPLAAAFAVTCVSSFIYSYIQYSIYHHLGAPPTYWTVFRITSISQLGKYLPGKVLFVGNFYLLSRAAGISNLHIGAAFVISMALWILTATLCGLPVLGLLEPALRYSILILPLLLALLINPRFFGLLLELAQGISGRLRSTSGVAPADLGVQADLLAKLDTVFYLRTTLLYLVVWALAGLGAYLCLAALTDIDPSAYPLALASIALGTVAGFLALFAPVGLGVREGIGALVLAPAVGADVALLSMVLLRGITVVVDLLLALLAMLTGRWFISDVALQE
jgi:uncharacterized membrane protein YbhN (UPF0104 family)